MIHLMDLIELVNLNHLVSIFVHRISAHTINAGGIGGGCCRDGPRTELGGANRHLKAILFQLLLACYRIKILICRIQGNIMPFVGAKLHNGISNTGELDIECHSLDHA